MTTRLATAGLVATGLAVSGLFVSVRAVAEEAVISDTPTTRGSSAIDYRKPRPVPLPATSPAEAAFTTPAATAEVGIGEPMVTPGFEPGRAETQRSRAHGVNGVPYSSSRVELGTVTAAGTVRANILSASHPYRMVGKLLASNGGYCTASVIKRGIIVTAAHCIQRLGSGVTFRVPTFVFIPGHYFSSKTTITQWQPYGTWSSRAVIVPTVWANGRDKGCGAVRENDIALIALQPRSGKLIGDVVGQFGIAYNDYGFIKSAATGNKRVADVTQLGYPLKSDGGNIMQVNHGPAYAGAACATNTIPIMQRGSDMSGGSSGGPWVLNFRSVDPVYSTGASAGADAGMAITGVTSSGSTVLTEKNMFASRFGQTSAFPLASYGAYGAGNIGFLLKTLCGYKPVGSTQTFEQLGYCR